MFAAIQKVLQEICQLNPQDKVLVGVSGGPDSLALMMLLHELDWNLAVAHLNHQLRAAAMMEEEGVRQWAKEIGMPFYSQRANVADFARQNSLSIEEAARYCRYRFLFDQAEKVNAKAVLVAHTADDQVETVLMRLLRGSGSAGLKGMKVVSIPNQWSTSIPLVRPLLSVWRAQIMDYLANKGIVPYLDESNLDNTYTRNRIRNSLLPLLESYNPSIRKLLWQTAQILADEEQVLRDQEEDAWQDAVTFTQENAIGFDLQKFRHYPQAIKRRLVRRAFQILHGNLADLSFAHVEEIVCFLDGRASSQQPLLSDLVCLRDLEQGYLTRGQAQLPFHRFPQLDSKEAIRLPDSGSLCLSQGWILQIERVSEFPFGLIKQAAVDCYEAWLDSEACKGSLYVRPPKTGDRFAPLSMNGKRAKISDIFINRKIPVWARRSYPLICTDTDILWVPGYTISHLARLTPESQEAVHLSIKQAG